MCIYIYIYIYIYTYIYRRLSDITLRDGVQGTLFRDARTLWLVPTRAMAHNTNLARLEEFHVQLVTNQWIQ